MHGVLCRTGVVRVGLRIFRPQTVAWLREALLQGQLSRAALGRGVCEREDWRNRKGESCTASARKALPALAAQLGLELPLAQPGPPACQRRSSPAPAACFSGSLEELGAGRLRPAHPEVFPSKPTLRPEQVLVRHDLCRPLSKRGSDDCDTCSQRSRNAHRPIIVSKF